MPADATGGERPVFGSAWGVVVFGIIQLVASIPAVLSVRYIAWSDLIWGTTMMPLLVYWMKFVVPLGIAVILVYGWWDALRG